MERLVIKESGRVFFIKASEIHWIEAAGNYVRLHLDDGAHLMRETMSRLEEGLDPDKFLRIHRSTIVNVDAVRELHIAKDNGACGVMQKGIELGRRSASDPYFFPLYQAASDLNIPICFHTGTSDPALNNTDALTNTFHTMMAPVIDAFLGLYTARIPERFPNLRFGFIEAMASWLPLALADLRAREERAGWLFPNLDVVDDLVRASRFYVACQTVEDLPYLISKCGEDNLIAGTDYTHADQSSEIETLSIIRRMGDEGIITREQAAKILEHNPKAFYGL